MTPFHGQGINQSTGHSLGSAADESMLGTSIVAEPVNPNGLPVTGVPHALVWEQTPPETRICLHLWSEKRHDLLQIGTVDIFLGHQCRTPIIRSC